MLVLTYQFHVQRIVLANCLLKAETHVLGGEQSYVKFYTQIPDIKMLSVAAAGVL